MDVSVGGVFLFLLGVVFAGGPAAYLAIILPMSLFGPDWLQKLLEKPRVTFILWVLTSILLTAFIAHTFKNSSGYDPHECKDTLQGLSCS